MSTNNLAGLITLAKPVLSQSRNVTFADSLKLLLRLTRLSLKGIRNRVARNRFGHSQHVSSAAVPTDHTRPVLDPVPTTRTPVRLDYLKQLHLSCSRCTLSLRCARPGGDRCHGRSRDVRDQCDLPLAQLAFQQKPFDESCFPFGNHSSISGKERLPLCLRAYHSYSIPNGFPFRH